MSLEIVPFGDEHLEGAAALLAARHRAVRQRQPLLPARFEDGAETLPLLQRFLHSPRRGPCVAALREGRLAGYLLGGWPAWDPTAAVTGLELFAVDAADGAQTLQGMYAAVADEWLSKGCFLHRVKVFASERDDMEAWLSLGFGQFDLQVLRDTSSVPGEEARVEVRRALPEDAELAMGLQLEFARYWEMPPVFQPFLTSDDALRKETAARLADPGRPCWVGYRGGDAVAFIALRPGPGSGLSPLVQLEHMAFVEWAFTRDPDRNGDVASAMLNHALDWARGQGYEYCYSGLYSADMPARRFWLGKGFHPVACWLERRIDQRIAALHSEGPGSP